MELRLWLEGSEVKNNWVRASSSLNKIFLIFYALFKKKINKKKCSKNVNCSNVSNSVGYVACRSLYCTYGNKHKIKYAVHLATITEIFLRFHIMLVLLLPPNKQIRSVQRQIVEIRETEHDSSKITLSKGRIK